MRKLVFLVTLVLSFYCTTLSAEEDDIWFCQGGNPQTCSQRYVQCVAQYGGQPDPAGSGSTLCEARYQACLESGGGCYPVY